MTTNMMKMMNTNGDGMLSKAEFMNGHEQMFERVAGRNGTIAMNDMPMNCMGMMGQGGMTGQGGMMGQDHQMPGRPGRQSK